MNSSTQMGYKEGCRSDRFVCFVFMAMVFTYAIFYPNFIFIVFIPITVRFSIEAVVLLLLVLISIRNEYTREQLFIICALAIFLLLYLFGIGNSRELLSSLNKIIFLVLLARLLMGVRTMLDYAKSGWILLWTFLSIISILSFLGYVSGLANFKYLQFGGYTYFSHPILGIIVLKNLFGFTVPRIFGYMPGGGQLSFFFGWNALISKYIIYNPVRSKYFTVLNILAGFLTLSMSFGGFMIFWLLFLFVKKFRMGKTVIVLICSFLLLFIFKIFFAFELEQYSSFVNRMIRFGYVPMMIKNSSVVSLLFGNGIGSFGRETGYGMSSGLLDIFLERGAILFGFVGYLFIKYTRHNFLLFFLIFYYFIFINLTWSPIFLFSLAIGYASYHERNIVMQSTI